MLRPAEPQKWQFDWKVLYELGETRNRKQSISLFILYLGETYVKE